MADQKRNPQSLQLVLILEEPPGVGLGEFGLQERNQSLLAGKPVGAGLELRCTIEALIGQESIDFRGQFVHGPVADRFLYLALRGANGAWVRRMKVGLGGITHALISTAHADGTTLVATITRMDSSRAKLQTADWRKE